MKIDNTLNASKLRLFFVLLLSFMAICLWFFIGVTNYSKVTNIAMLVFFILAIDIYVAMHIAGLNYFIFDDENGKYTFKYFPIHPMFTKRQKIEILQSDFERFEIKTSFFGLRKELILYQIVKDGVAAYPPIRISALTKNEIRSLKNALDKNK